MKKNTLKKVFSALSLTAVAASALSLSAFAAPSDYTAGQIANSAIKPKLTTTKLVVGKDQAGQDVKVNIDVADADGKYCNTGIRLYYSDRLTIKKKANGKEDISAGDAIADLGVKTNKVDDSCTREGFDSWFFTTGGEGDYGVDGTMWTITFTIPADAKEGEVFPLDIIYQAVGSTKDAFFDKNRTEAGQLMEAYVFTQGIYCADNPTFAASAADVAACPALASIDNTYDGYIAIAGGVTSTSTSTTTATTSTTTATTSTTTATTSTTTATTSTTTATTSTTGSSSTSTASTSKTGSTSKSSSTTSSTTTTTKKDGSPKTGVAGVGVAAAGLAVAIGTAFVLRKKED